VEAVVTAGGRLFTIFDEGQTGVYRKLPQRCKLVARDAANGILLWKVPLEKWQPEFGTGRGARWEIHHTIPRRLVAAGDRVYVTLRFLDSPVSVLDAATGEVLTEALEGTTGTDEMILSDGVLIAKVTEKRSMGAKARFGKEALKDALTAVDVASGKALWRREKVRVVPYALSAQAGRVVYHNMEELVCLEAKTGKEVWSTSHVMGRTRGGDNTLVISDGVVLFHGPGKLEGAKKGGRSLIALSLDDGEVMWTRGGKPSLAQACNQPTDVFVTNGIVWCGTSTEGVDLRTGKVVRRVKLHKLISPGHHYRCHRAKATTQFLIWPKRGAEFVDVDGEEHMRNDWLRAPCFTGATPANGLFYAPPSQCFCYPGVKVSGFLAMAAQPADELEASTDEDVHRGPAFGEVGDGTAASAEDWPMHRHDVQRSGCTSAAVSAELSEAWAVDLACEGTQPVIVGGRLWVVEKDAQRVRCLDAATGKDMWSFTAGGRIDSAPTIHQGRVLFGCRDGSVYCLRASDGARVWRFRAAPADRRLMAFEQVESVWPVHGSILVQDGVAYFAAGRSSFLDGGIVVYGLDPKTGKVLHSHRLEGPWPDIKEDTGRPFAMEGALPDLFVSDGQNLYMQRIKFDAELNRLATKRESPLGELDMGAKHLVATGGFLDDTGFDRLYWMHSRRWPGFYFAQHAPKSGQLVVFNDSTTFAVKYFYRRIQWSPLLIPGGQGYLLFADDIGNEPTFLKKGQKNPQLQWLPEGAYSDRHRRGGRGVEKGTGYVREKPPKWQELIPVRVRAMVLAGDRLFAAGPPDAVDSDDPYAAFEGRKGAVIQVVSASDGTRLAETALPAPPAFDGLSAANGNLYLATTDGRLLCLAGAE
jgi:outer membrane protein assembly factor BamB